MQNAEIDEATLASLEAAAGAEFVTELVATFRDEVPVMQQALRESLANGDAERFRRTAHSLKSNAATFGALSLTQLARDLEAGGLAIADTQKLATLDAELSRAIAALTARTR